MPLPGGLGPQSPLKFVVSEAVLGLPTGPVTPQIYATQENVDLGIEGWARGTSLLAQGLVPFLVIGAMQFPQEVRAQVFQSVKTPPVVATVSKFFSVPQQQYADTSGQVFVPVSGFTPRTIQIFQGGPQLLDLALQAQFSEPSPANQGRVPPLTAGNPQPDMTQYSQVYGSVRTPPALASGIIPPFTRAAPEQIDLGIEGWVRGTTLLNQGNVPPFTRASPQLDVTQSTNIWAPAKTQPAVLTGPVPPTVLASPQPDTTQASKVWPSLRTPPVVTTGPVPVMVVTGPQNPTQIAPVVWDSATDLQGDSLSSEYRHGGHALALHAAEGLKSRLFQSAPTVPVVSGFLGSVVLTLPQNEERPVRQIFTSKASGQTTPVIRSLWAAPQLADLTLQASISGATLTPVVVGVTVVPVPPVSPQFDISANGTVVWTQSTFSPSAPVPDSGAGLPAGDGRSPHHGFNLSDWKKKRKPLKDLEDDIERLYKEITSPPLARQAEKIVKPFVPPKLRAEIKPKNVEWDRVVESIRTIEKLHALYEQEIKDDDDDIEDFLTLL